MPVILTKKDHRLLPLLLVALSLCACGAQPPAATPAPASAPSEPAPLAVLSMSEGVEVQNLLAWSPPFQKDLLDLHLVAPGRLLVRRGDGLRSSRVDILLGLDLDTGGEVFSLDLTPYGTECRVRPDTAAPGAFRIETPGGFHRLAWGGERVAEYTLPQDIRPNGEHRYGWDALPEEDKLAWTDEKGLWLARADGSGAALVLATGAIGEQPEFAQLAAERQKDDNPVTFRRPEFLAGGRYLAVTFGSAIYMVDDQGVAVFDSQTGETCWHRGSPPFQQNGLEWFDSTTLLAGGTLIDAVTGESREIPYWDRASRLGALSGGRAFSFRVEETGGQYRLMTRNEKQWWKDLTVLTLPKHQPPAFDGAYERFMVLAAEGRRAVCCYQRPGEAGLLLVTLPEPPPPALLPAQGVACRTLASWPAGETGWDSAFFPPREGLVLVGQQDRDQDYRITGGQVLGVDMRAGTLSFTLPLTGDTDVRAALDGPAGAFHLVEGTSCACCRWASGGVRREDHYTLPPEVAREVKEWAATQGYTIQSGWDHRGDTIVWLTREGVWTAGADGSGLRLVISTEEICQRPEYAGYLETAQMMSDTVRETRECLDITGPRLMNGGNTLALPVRNRVSPYWPDDLLTIHLPTGERRWYDGVMIDMSGSDLWYRDDTTILAGWSSMSQETVTCIDLAGGAARKLEGWPSGLWTMLGSTGDGKTFFSADRQEGELYLLEVEELGPPPAVEDYGQTIQALWDRRRTILTTQGDCYIHGPLAVDGKRLLFTYSTGWNTPEAVTCLVLLTCP